MIKSNLPVILLKNLVLLPYEEVKILPELRALRESVTTM